MKKENIEDYINQLIDAKLEDIKNLIIASSIRSEMGSYNYEFNDFNNIYISPKGTRSGMVGNSIILDTIEHLEDVKKDVETFHRRRKLKENK